MPSRHPGSRTQFDTRSQRSGIRTLGIGLDSLAKGTTQLDGNPGPGNLQGVSGGGSGWIGYHQFHAANKAVEETVRAASVSGTQFSLELTLFSDASTNPDEEGS